MPTLRKRIALLTDRATRASSLCDGGDGRVKKLRFVDLFAGLGGFHVALERLGHECVLASEIEPTLRDIYAANFGIIPEGDIRAIDPTTAPAFDILCAGFPCQPFSKAGFQAGLNCERNGDLAGIVLDWIKLRRPSYFILENVPNFEAHDNGRTWRWLDRELRHAGYANPQKLVLSPHQFGIPQIRERLFIVGAREGLADFRWPEASGEQTDIRAVLNPPDEAIRIPAKVERAIEIWDEFVRSYPKGARKPWFPVWAAEFGATYPYTVAPPGTVSQLDGFRGAFGQPLAKLDAAQQIVALPPYARTTTAFPGWKKGFIDLNRQLYNEQRGWIDKWLPKLAEFEHSYQKFEWNFDESVGSVWNSVIQMRGSGIRAKSPRSAPALIASSTSQVPIIGWERRYMTPRECAKLQDLGELTHLPASFGATTRALGNAVNARVVEQVAFNLVGTAPRLSLVVNG